MIEFLLTHPQATVEYTSRITNETRKGVYIKIKSGMVTLVYFLGRDENDQLIEEWVGP